MDNRSLKKTKSAQSRSKKTDRAKTKSCRKDVAVFLPIPGVDEFGIGIMEHNCAAKSPSTQATSLPSPVLKADSAPNGGIDSCDLNIKQVQPLLDGSNVSAPKIPLATTQQDKEVSDSPMPEAPPFQLKPANDQEIPTLENDEKNKENVSWQGTTSPMEIGPVKEGQLFTRMDTDQDQQISHVNGIGGTGTDIASNLTISPSHELINNKEELSLDILQQHYKNGRPKTPTEPIPTVTDIFSPNTVKEFRSTVRALFPNGPPPPKPVIPVKRHKKGDVPYIVGCTTRRRVPEKKSLSFFKGDKYGITEETNSFDNDECPSKRKSIKRNHYANWSKSRFNPKSEEIAARLKINESVDNMLRKSPSKETVSYMSKPYTPRPQAFSPLPSTSKDSETIMKNEQQFSESLKYENDNFDVGDDDDELPEIKWDSKSNNEKRRHHSLIQSKDLELITNEESLVKSEDLNNNNDMGPEEDYFCEIQFDKYLPKKEYTIPTVTTSAIGNASNDPIIINEIDNKATEPKRVLGEITKTVDTHEINDEYSSLTYEDLYAVPKTTEIVDVDELFRDIENFQQRKRKRNSDVITIVDPAYTIADSVTSPIQSNQPSTSRSQNFSSNSDVEFVSETIADQQNGKKNDIETVVHGFFNKDNYNSTSLMPRRPNLSTTNTNVINGLDMLLAFLSESSNRFSQPKRRKKTKRQSPKKPREQPQQEHGTVNNENAAPSTNEQVKPATNGERKLGDCPICMENLSRNAIASTTCGHVFCLDCIKKCLRTSGKKCPTCRKPLKGAGYHQVFL